MSIVQLPTWDECRDKINEGLPIDVLEQFIYDNEPVYPKSADWRVTLGKLIDAVEAGL